MSFDNRIFWTEESYEVPIEEILFPYIYMGIAVIIFIANLYK